MLPLSLGIGLDIFHAYSSPNGGAGPSYDPDAQAFFDASGVSDNTQKSAVNELVLGLKAAGLWSMFFALYPYVGGDATKHSFNLKNPAQYQMTWNGSITHDAGGIKGDGATGYGNTGVAGNMEPHIGIFSYIRDADTTGAGAWRYMGSSDDFSVFNMIDYDNTGGNKRGFLTGQSVIVVGSQPLRLYSIQRNGSTELHLFEQNNELGSNGAGEGGTPAANYYVLATSAFGVFNGPTNSQSALHAITQGMDSTQVGQFSALVDTFQTALSRNV